MSTPTDEATGTTAPGETATATATATETETETETETDGLRHRTAFTCRATQDAAAATVAVAALLHRFSGEDLHVTGADGQGEPAFPHPLRADARMLDAGLDAVLAAPDAYAPRHSVAHRPADLAVRAGRQPDGSLRVTLDVAAHLLTAGTLQALTEYGPRFTAHAVGEPGLPLKQLPAADEPPPSGPDEQRPAQDVPVHALVERATRLHGDAVAVGAGDMTLTYAQLWQRACRVAAGLRAGGSAPGTFVGLMAERGPDAVVALLALSLAGACSVPLDPSYPDQRLALMLDDPRVTAVVATGDLAHRVPASVPTLLLDDLAAAGEAAGPVPDHEDAGPATLMYTSGSTGAPKGVEITHRGITRLVTDDHTIGFRPGDVVLHYAPLPFDASLLEIWGALANGARLELAPPGPLSLSELAEVIKDRGVTTLWLTAGLFHQLAEYEPGCLERVRRLFTGGDVVSPHHVRAVLTRWPGLEVVNGYGPTENTTFTCCHHIRDVDEAAGPSVPIGTPVAGTRVHLLDPYGNPVPPGVPGELWTSGEGLARGYARRPDLTAERFATPADGPLRGVRMYRTGDLAYQREDGTLEFLGRRDLQVKVNGFRIELAEIESAVLEHAGVGQVCVTVEADALGGKCLSAYVVATTGAEIRPRLVRELRTELRARIPQFMIPTRWTLVDALPLTGNGKVDRARLASAAAPQKG